MKIFSPCNFSCVIWGGENLYSCLCYQNQSFSVMSHLCRSCRTHVVLVSHSCCSCCTRVPRVLHYSCCKLDYNNFVNFLMYFCYKIDIRQKIHPNQETCLTYVHLNTLETDYIPVSTEVMYNDTLYCKLIGIFHQTFIQFVIQISDSFVMIFS